MHEFFEVLQKEYIYCRIREQVYPIPKDKEYWQRSAETKKKKIGEIAELNNLSSIFSFKDAYAKVFNDIIGYGIPEFYYPNEANKEKQRHWDVRNYFCKGVDVKVSLNENENIVGKVRRINYLSESALVEENSGESYEVNFDQMSRILS